jgi:soluble lytic murein transglycosylase
MANPRNWWRLGLTLLLLLGAGAGWLWRFSPDFAYGASERIFPHRFHRFDPMIMEVAGRHKVDPMLVKAIVWRESKLMPSKEGSAGERGLMQIREDAAFEWAKAEKIASFVPTDLFDPKTNLEAGTWYLAQALNRWKDKDDPLPFALAEYNAGRRNVQRWVDDARVREEEQERRQPGSTDSRVSGDELAESIGFPGTKAYVAAVRRRMEFYRTRGRM